MHHQFRQNRSIHCGDSDFTIVQYDYNLPFGLQNYGPHFTYTSALTVRKFWYVFYPLMVRMSAFYTSPHNSIENDYCSGKQGFVVGQLGLVESVGLGLVRSLRSGLRVMVSVSVSGSGDKPGLPPE